MVLQPIKMIILGDVGRCNNMDNVYVQRFPMKWKIAELH